MQEKNLQIPKSDSTPKHYTNVELVYSRSKTLLWEKQFGISDRLLATKLKANFTVCKCNKTRTEMTI